MWSIRSEFARVQLGEGLDRHLNQTIWVKLQLCVYVQHTTDCWAFGDFACTACESAGHDVQMTLSNSLQTATETKLSFPHSRRTTYFTYAANEQTALKSFVQNTQTSLQKLRFLCTFMENF